jgi:hypothetical protein
MPLYNIIYDASRRKSYLWNGNTLDLLKNTGNKNLFFSGKTFKPEELDHEVEKCKSVIKSIFKDDSPPQVKAVEIQVSK